MLISDLLSPESIRCDVHSSSKKRLLEIISEELARNNEDLSAREIFESLCARERLGSTGLGKGVAIPHGRIKGNRPIRASFIRLKKPLAYDALDGEPVDLLFAMTVPENCGEDHLKLLAHIAELFSDPELLQDLRDAGNSGDLLKLLSSKRSANKANTHH
ncbi:MAG: PTS IIA-like nitrogen regulatory protein PtsN [Xanthomonadales bacterium]|nr:PTS IIA-like nitrogen regulatory protein PtsN [Xanthomonadales bacterium]